MFTVYILLSQSYNHFYVGQTNNMEARLHRHNSGFEKATKPYMPWEIKLTISKSTRAEAMILEKKLKNLSRARLILFIDKYGNNEKVFEEK